MVGSGDFESDGADGSQAGSSEDVVDGEPSGTKAGGKGADPPGGCAGKASVRIEEAPVADPGGYVEIAGDDGRGAGLAEADRQTR